MMGGSGRTPVRLRFLWYALSVVTIVLAPSHVLLATPVWRVPGNRHVFLFGLAVAYALAVLGIEWRGRAMGSRLRDALVWPSAAFGGLSFVVLMVGASYSRSVLLGAFVLAILLAIFPHTVVFARPRPVLVAYAIAVAALAVRGVQLDARTARAPVEKRYTATSLYNVQLTVYHDRIVPETNGGGLAALADGSFLLTVGDGRLFHLVRRVDDGSLDIRALPYRVPINRAEFISDMPADILTARFRVADVLVLERGDSVRVLVSHHYWTRSAQCFTLRVSLVDADRRAFLQGESADRWRTLYETRPCLGLIPDARESRFAGHQMGGRLVEWRPDTVMLSVGDHLFDGWNSATNLPQDPEAEYGKTILIDVARGGTRIFSTGHRNPQGLYVDGQGTIWLTEHGPEGGDELNIVAEGENYGWPLVTYGTEYGLSVWPLSTTQGSHEGFRRPVFVWTPAIGVSSVVGVRRDLFAWWRNDLLVGSLKAGTIWRMRVHDERVVLVEPVVIGLGVRDLIEADDGRLVLWLDGGSIGVLEPAPDGAAGELVFAQCRGCHQMGDGSMHGIGPDLGGVVGRAIGSARGYAYSSAMRALSGRWSPERLDRFLADPQGDVPGTAMQVPGIPDAGRRAAIIAHLRAPVSR